MTNMIPSMGSYLNCLIYLWIRLPQEELESLNARITNIKEISEKEGANENFPKKLDHHIDNIKDVRDITAVNPLDGSPERIIKKILKSKPITDAKRVFNNSTKS